MSPLTMRMFAAATRQSSLIAIRIRHHTLKQYRYLSTGPITAAYQRHIQAGAIRHDNDQLQLASRLDDLHDSLQSTDARIVASHKLVLLSDKSLLQRAKHYIFFKLFPPPRGLYIFGNVGVGKSFLMDLFHDECKNKSKRVHFHEFMLNVHQRIHDYKQTHPKGDALLAVALDLSNESRLLCFDEFQVTDIADAMILKRLFAMLLEAGVVVVATSNRAPESLYEGGINRNLFLPFIDTLKANLDVVEMTGGHDYRRDGTMSETDESSPFFWPSRDGRVRLALEHIFYSDETEARAETVPVMMGRAVKVPKATDTVAWFDFMDLCHQPLGAADYIALCERYNVLIVDNVPQLNSSRFNEARCFVTLIDALYETKTRLVMACDVPLEDLFVDFEATVETHDGDEEIAIQEPPIQGQTGDEESFVKGEGGSSSSAATTMIRTKDGDVEWSATGRIGVSLARGAGAKPMPPPPSPS